METLENETSPSATRDTHSASEWKLAGLSPERLARMHHTLRRYVDSARLPGLVAVVSRRGVQHTDAMGTLALDRDAPMAADTIFRIASVTKPVTAVAAMILVEECRLRLDDPLDEFLPELANRRVLRSIESELDDTVPAVRAITLRDLLTYRSGYGELLFLSPACPLQRALAAAGLPLSAWMFRGSGDEYMRRIGELPLAFQPGERWLYHTSGEILGVLIARASGMPLSSFLRERIFEPLGMIDSGFTVPPEKLGRVATCYMEDPSSGALAPIPDADTSLLSRPVEFESGAGDQFLSTAADLLAFGRMLLGGGAYRNERILSRPAVELMTTDHLTAEQKSTSPFFANFWDARGWGLGLSVITRRHAIAEVPGRFGWDGAFCTSMYVDPREHLVGVLMAQSRPAALRLPDVVLDFWTSVYQAIV